MNEEEKMMVLAWEQEYVSRTARRLSNLVVEPFQEQPLISNKSATRKPIKKAKIRAKQSKKSVIRKKRGRPKVKKRRPKATMKDNGVRRFIANLEETESCKEQIVNEATLFDKFKVEEHNDVPTCLVVRNLMINDSYKNISEIVIKPDESVYSLLQSSPLKEVTCLSVPSKKKEIPKMILFSDKKEIKKIKKTLPQKKKYINRKRGY